MNYFFPLLFLFISTNFNAQNEIDYTDLKNWVAHPDQVDGADFLPTTQFKDRQKESGIDVFFIYPTIYKDAWKDGRTNADIQDEKLNAKIIKTTIKNQASIFNGVGRVYSPFYRQANIKAYYKFEKDEARARKAFHLAYTDVKAAFLYYMENWNQGRPFIIASHSQGTTHGKRLLKELIDGKPLQDQMIVAYLVGMPVSKTYFNKLPLCEEASQTNCFCTWRTYTKGHYPKKQIYGDSIACTNPLNWKVDDTYADYKENKGSVVRKLKMENKLIDAQVHKGLLWVGKLNMKGAALLRRKNWHIADFNFYWVNVRENARERAAVFIEN